MELKDTIEMMQSDDYKERFKAEYHQLKNRYNKLDITTVKYEAGTLDSFTPSCSLELLKQQKRAMEEYLRCLKIRAEIEEISLTDIGTSPNIVACEWVSVENKAPKDGVIVLITDGCKSDVGFYNEESGTFVSGYDFCDDNCVTHWMPLPEPRT